MYRAGKVILANVPGSGIADDKSIYTFIPKMINFYLGGQFKKCRDMEM